MTGHWGWETVEEQYRNIVNNFGPARRMAAYQYPEMKLLWSTQEAEAFDARALCLSGGRIFELSPQQYAAARDAATGKVLWRKTPENAKPLFDAIGSSLKRHGWGLGWGTYLTARASRDVVCIAGPTFTKTIGIGLQKGDLLWTLNAESPHPFFVDDAFYVMPRVGNLKPQLDKNSKGTAAAGNRRGKEDERFEHQRLLQHVSQGRLSANRPAHRQSPRSVHTRRDRHLHAVDGHAHAVSIIVP